MARKKERTRSEKDKQEKEAKKGVVDAREARRIVRQRVENLRREISSLKFYADPLFVARKIAEEEAIIEKATKQIALYRHYQESTITRLPASQQELKSLLARLKRFSDPRVAKMEKLKKQLADLEKQQKEADRELASSP